MFLPTTIREMAARGWDRPDILLVSGDAYVDHPSFGHAVISRVLEARGFRVAVLAQPDYAQGRSFAALGEPRVAVLVAHGVVDSMVAHYTAAKKRRSEDAYSPGGKAGLRPDRATITYCNRIRSVWKRVPLIIGGLEASLRRFAHYDYWDGRVRRSILLDSGADLAVFGMGESAIAEVCERLRAGERVSNIRDVPGTCYASGAEGALAALQTWAASEAGHPGATGAGAGVDPGSGAGVRASQDEEMAGACDGSVAGSGDCHCPGPRSGASGSSGGMRRNRRRFLELPSAEECASDKIAYARAFMLAYGEQDPVRGAALYQRDGTMAIVQMPPSQPLGEAELDAVYELPYERAWHPSYDALGGVPALEEVRFSIVSHRGCYGGCSFCAIGYHQGRIVQKRSQASVVREAEAITRLSGFKGYIHDVGGPSANLRSPACRAQLRRGACKNRQCLHPEPCKKLESGHREYMALLRRVRAVPGVKKAFVRSGLRFDAIMHDRARDPSGRFLEELCEHHVSGQLKVAPEHVADRALRLMGKPGSGVYDAFCAEFRKACRSAGKEQYLVPYLISGHPGTTLADAVELAEYLRDARCSPEQVQDFYPTPGTLSTCMHYTGIDPRALRLSDDGRVVGIAAGGGKPAGGPTDKQAGGQASKQAGGPTGKQAGRPTGRQAGGHAGGLVSGHASGGHAGEAGGRTRVGDLPKQARLHVPDAEEKAMQRALLQYMRPRNRVLAEKALRLAGRADLIGYGPRCLVRPAGGASRQKDALRSGVRPAPKGDGQRLKGGRFERRHDGGPLRFDARTPRAEGQSFRSGGVQAQSRKPGTGSSSGSSSGSGSGGVTPRTGGGRRSMAGLIHPNRAPARRGRGKKTRR